MARLNKFASVNLNDSYGKPDRGGSANNSSNSNSSSSSSGKPRISSPGGMLILSRPGRSLQPPSPSPSPKPGQARLGIPSPVNLPSLKRETSAGDTLAASPPIAAGWTKAGESPPLTGWSKGENPIDVPSPFHQKAGLSRSLDTVGESLNAMSSGKPDVYAPPAMRAATQTGSASRVPPPSPPQLEKPSAIIRGEEFPTLQAAVARPPTPPQHLRQRDLQQKQREKQQEAKEQQLKLQQLSQAQGNKPAPADGLQSGNGNLQSQPPVLSLRPLGKPETPHQKANTEASVLDPYSASTHSSKVLSDGSLSWSPPVGSIGNKGSSVFVDRSSLSRSPPTGIPSQGNLSRVDEARADSGHNLRPQYKSPLPVSQSGPTVEGRHSGFQSNSESSWLSSSRRDFTPLPWNTDHSKPSGSALTNVGDDTGRLPFEMRGAPLAKENYVSKDSVLFREGSASGFVQEDTHVEQGTFAREGSDPKVFGRSSTLAHDGIPRIEGFQSQHSFRREIHDRESREGFVRVIRESGSREINSDQYGRDNRDSRQTANRDCGDTYDRDDKESSSRDSRNVYMRDVREVYNQDAPISKQMGYGNYSSNINGENSWRAHSGHVDLPYGKGSVSPAGISPNHNPNSAYDSYGGKRYGPQGMGDQSFAREARVGADPRAARVQYAEPAGPYSSTLEMIGSRRVRSPGPSSSSFDSVKEVHEVRPERPQRFHEDRPTRYEDKVIDMKGVANESFGSSLITQRPVSKGELGQGLGTRTFQVNTSKKLDDERPSREEVKKQLALEDERRKEAAKLKLMELEERIAKRALEGRKDEVEVKDKEPVEVFSLKQLGLEQSPSNARYDLEGVASIQARDSDVVRREEDPGLRLARPSSASSVSSRTYKIPAEGPTSSEERDLGIIGEGEFNQDKKLVRSRSPNLWRKEIGGGPTSKLFSSPYIESGGFRRPSDGGTYKLF